LVPELWGPKIYMSDFNNMGVDLGQGHPTHVALWVADSVCNGKIFEPIFGIFRYYAITENFGRFRSVFRFLCLHYLIDENFYLESVKLSNLCN
jgi:hypothetical protein